MEQLIDENAGLAHERTLLAAQRDHLHQEFTQLEEEITVLVREKDSLTAENAAVAEKCERFYQENTQVWDKVTRLSEENASLSEVSAARASENEQLRHDGERLCEQIVQLIDQVTHLTREQSGLLEERERLQQEKDGLAADVARAFQETAEVTDKNTKILAELDRLRAETERQRDDISQLCNAQTALIAEKTALAEQDAVLASALDDARQQLVDVQQRCVLLTEHEQVALALQRQLNDSQQRLAEADKTATQFKADLTETRRQVAQLHDEVARILADKASLAVESADIAEDRERIRQENNRLADELARTSSDKKALDDELVKLATEREQMLLESTQARDKIARLSAENTAIVAAAPELEEERDRLRQENNRLNQELAKLASHVSALLEKNLALEADCDRFRDEIGRLDKRIAADADRKSDAAHENSRLASENEELSAAPSDVRQKLAESNSQLADIMRGVEDLDQELIALWADQRQSGQASFGPADVRADGETAHEDAAQFDSEWDHELSRTEADDPWLRDTQSTAQCNPFSGFSTCDEGTEGHQSGTNETHAALVSAWGVATVAEQPTSAGQVHKDAAPPVSTGDEFGSFTVSEELKTRSQSAEHSAAERLGQENEPGSNVGAQPVNPRSFSPLAPTAATLPAPPKTESYIDRYSHLFAEDGQTDEEAAPSSLVQSNQNRSSQPASIARRPAGQASAESDEDEMEQYMAKLLQRVNGGAPPKPELTTVAPHNRKKVASHGEVSRGQFVNVSTQHVPVGEAASSPAPAVEERVLTSLGTTRGKAKVNERPANLAALRALANESARRAIGKHSRQVHRREAFSKAIVSAMAAMVSVWLIVEVPSWRDPHFTAACVMLLAAAYLAGRSCGALVEAFRAASYGGLPTAAAEATAPSRPPLPIDVER